ncbi:MAG: M48 family metallopeptidase [Arenicella sp.]
MDFFEYQRQARRKSRWLIVGVILSALVIIAAVNIIVVILLGWGDLASVTTMQGAYQPSVFHGLFSAEFLSKNSSALIGSSLAVTALISLSSLGKIASLRSGGGKVARNLGGDLVTADHRDPLRRRLYNVVEEISIASGLPVPEVYVLEHESGINAFAAGYSQSDAAIAVTRGTLEKLNRSELQGVIAHEFSHILNGDMRINIRLMGVLFGILVLAIIGRRLLTSGRYTRSSSNSGKGTSVVVMLGFGLMLIGYIGLFFARWMKASLSRQREYLADASAVQFTREPSGLANALKKIATSSHHSYLTADTEEISHMLFGNGERPMMFSSKLFSTHPPLMKRIKRIEPHFNERQLSRFAKKVQKIELREHTQAEVAEQEAAEATKAKKSQPFDVHSVIKDIGNPKIEQILAAAILTESLPKALEQAAHSIEWAPEVMLFALLDNDPLVRDKQLLVIYESLGDLSEKKLQHIISSCQRLEIEQRLPLLEMTFPEVKRRPIDELEKLQQTIERVIAADERVDPFEFLLSKVIKLHIDDARQPNNARILGNKRLQDFIPETVTIISVLAMHGHDNLPAAQLGFKQGVESLGLKDKNIIINDDWTSRVESALVKLNELRAADKKLLVMGMAETILHDGKVTATEHELLRAICASIHVPLPVLA